MDELFPAFIALLHQYTAHYTALYHHLEPHLALKPFTHDSFDFTPTEQTIARQIQAWPGGPFIYPPAAWVEPRTGRLVIGGEEWSFAFHGGGLSFFHSLSRLDVSIEFSQNGCAAFTEYTFEIYLKESDQDSSQMFTLQGGKPRSFSSGRNAPRFRGFSPQLHRRSIGGTLLRV